MAHPRRAHGREVPRLPPHPEAPAPPQARRVGVHGRRGRRGGLLFDPFCGSGTTGVAAKELGRFFVGAEREREYAGLAERRIGAAQRGITLGEIRAIGDGNPQRGRRGIGVKRYEVGMDEL